MKSELSPETRSVEMTEGEFLKYTFFTALETPLFTCIAMGINEILNLLG